MPFVSFWQVSADLALAFSTEPGHGHNYTGEHVDGWAAILQPDGWTPGEGRRAAGDRAVGSDVAGVPGR